ncbi:hypothetical protein GGR50DRAFT_695252 [Xylaria sp. CBS 124048]|nr:hypothetical protein GGR50DRAFT_695252 [Xylaria sp. CBS 124048]
MFPFAIFTLLVTAASCQRLSSPKSAANIPVSEVGCWKHDAIDPANIEDAKAKLEDWGTKHRLGNGSFQGEKTADSGVWICNCKKSGYDHIVAAELDEAQALVENECGVGVAGWVWSSKWQKSYNFGTAKRMDDHNTHSDKCPTSCLWN